MEDEKIRCIGSGSEEEDLETPALSVQSSLKGSIDIQSCKSVESEFDSDSDDEPYVAPPHLVQIIASKAEVVQMMKSFIAGRRARVNQQNIREFCGPDYDGQSCARVSAVHFSKRLVQVEDAEKYWARFKKK